MKLLQSKQVATTQLSDFLAGFIFGLKLVDQIHSIGDSSEMSASLLQDEKFGKWLEGSRGETMEFQGLKVLSETVAQP